MRTLLICSLLVTLSACRRSPLERKPASIDDLAIEVSGQSREVGYTNKEAGFFYTESNGYHRNAWQGWHIMSQKMLKDYQLFMDEKPLERTAVNLTTVLPHQFTRGYNVGVQETVTLLDSVDAIVVELQKIKGSSAALLPLFSDSQERSEYVVEQRDGVLMIAKRRHLKQTERENYPVWLGVYSAGQQIAEDSSVGFRGFALAKVSVAARDGAAAFVIVAGNTREETVALAKTAYEQRTRLIAARRARMEGILQRSYLHTNDERFNKATAWAKLSMDAMIMNQLKKGIFAGLPWFSNYWGRDSFISLPGATLVVGNFDEAKRILQSFAEWQEKDPASTNEGRIPNLVTPSSIAYNTADGTPWFVLALFNYVTYSGDTAYARSLFPVVRRSIDGTLRHHVDKNYFLVHGDAETWMDAVGPEGPWSPRGNRANDIQALWYKQLAVAAWFAEMFGDSRSSSQWSEIAEKLEQNFDEQFVDAEHGIVYDHLNADGTHDTQLRPNQIFTLDILPDQQTRKSVFQAVTEKLVYEQGVGSLSQDDENFHPYHHIEPLYVQDAAYHQGIIWTWLAGRWIEAATEFGLPDIAYRVTDDMIHQILERGAVGTLSELLDAAPRQGEKEPRLSGTFSQAWSLAEFQRNAYQSYLGITVDAIGNQVWLSPRLPKQINTVDVDIAIKNSTLRVVYDRKDRISQAWVDSRAMHDPVSVTLSWPFESGFGPAARFTLQPNKMIHLLITDRGYAQSEDADTMYLEQSGSQQVGHPELENLSLAVAFVKSGLKSLQGPQYPLLTNSDVKQPSGSARVLFDAADPVGDDIGTGKFVYPTTPNLKPGSLDITHATVSRDEKNTYFDLKFKNLSDPGWHPEYGFQLTYAAIAIDTDGRKKSGQNVVGRNANTTITNSLGYEKIVFVGGGIRVEDAVANVLAAYNPRIGDETNPLGSSSSKRVTFSLPNNLLPGLSSTSTVWILVGAQDDHGGAGIGDFRSVETTAGEWVGGGKLHKSEPNVYDSMILKQ